MCLFIWNQKSNKCTIIVRFLCNNINKYICHKHTLTDIVYCDNMYLEKGGIPCRLHQIS